MFCIKPEIKKFIFIFFMLVLLMKNLIDQPYLTDIGKENFESGEAFLVIALFFTFLTHS